MLDNKEKIGLTLILCFFVIIYFIESGVLKNKYNKLFPFLLFIIVFLYHFLYKQYNVKDLYFNDTIFLTWFILCTIMTLYILYNDKVLNDKFDDERLKEAVKLAYIGLLVAYFYKLEQLMSIYFIILLFCFFNDEYWY